MSGGQAMRTSPAEAAQGGPPDPKWWGWGEPGKRIRLDEPARAMLRERLGAGEPAEQVPLEAVELPDPRPVADAVLRAAGDHGVRVDRAARVRHSAGKSYPDLLRLRRGKLPYAPDAVLVPPSVDAVAAVIGACSREGVAVVPFGGGTSVVGGVDPLRGSHGAVISLDLRRLRSVSVDSTSMLARLGPGLRGSEVERRLAPHGLTLGHFPQSFEYATVGGFAATRSAGQASSGYGRFDEQLAALTLASPVGELRTHDVAHSAAGPALRELVSGSEGTLGVITEVLARVRPVPAAGRYEGWIAGSFEEGAEIVRSLAQVRALPDVLRLSDREETEISVALSGASSVARTALGAYLGLRRRIGGSILICGWEGEHAEVEHRRRRAITLLRRGGAVPLGRRPGEAWRRGRFEGPYLRDELIDLGYLVETLETAHTWSGLAGLYAAVRGAIGKALASAGTPPIVFCHVSHAYPDAASLYFTFIARARPGEETAQWRAAKDAACRAIVEAGGTITHHHAVGRDHAAYMPSELGDVGVDALRALKERLDPAGVMNPGKLLP